MFLEPQNVIEQMELQSGMRVADLGAGTGTLSLLASRAVGEAGRVYAIEVQKSLLERLKKEAREARLHNVEALWGDIERINGTHLGAASIDAAIASNVLFQVEDKAGFTAEVKRILKPGGKLLLVDWTDSFNGMGPHKDHVISERSARELFEAAGFRFVKNIDAGAHHYGLVLRKT